MTDQEMELLAEKLARKLQKEVIEGVYRDAGKNLFTMARNALWGLIVALAAWGAARYGGQGQ